MAVQLSSLLNLSSGSKHVFNFAVLSFPVKDSPAPTEHVKVDLLV
jgi:hypothetical protein